MAEHEKFDLVIQQMREALGEELDHEHANLHDTPTSLMQTAEIKTILDDLKDLGTNWRFIKATLSDADGRGMLPTDLDREWMSELRMLTYKAEYLHEICLYQLTAHQVQEQEYNNAQADQSNLFAQMAVSPSPLGDDSFWKDITNHISEFNKRFIEVKASVHLRTDFVVKEKKTEFFFNPIPTGFLPPCESLLPGRKKDLDKLVDLLKKEDSKGVEVIAIVGIGGVGKTTLAQHIYQTLDDSGYFDFMGWVFVSENFDTVALTRAALNTLSEEEFIGKELAPLQLKLLKLLKGKKFFLVMDDIWNDDEQKWDSFFAPFQKARKGSKILITTREKPFARTAGASITNKLGCLTEDDGWSLFRQHAFANPHEEHPEELVAIGKNIVKKCGYLPLAVKLLASSLKNEDHHIWRHVLESKLLNFQVKRWKQILGALYFSYLQLPETLKDCFKICSLFRKGEMIDRKELAEIHNLVMADNRGELYEKADGYISELKSRSFFELKWFGDKISIHDLLYDLLECISEDNYHIATPTNSGRLELLLPEHVRRARIVLEEDGDWDFNFRAINLHTLCIRNETSRIVFPGIQISGLTSLRILCITGEQSQNTRVHNLDDCLQRSKLLHGFTYRDQIEEVPDSLFTLYNLRRLDFSGSKMLMYLPYSIVKLKNLEHLDLSRTGITMLPRGITSLIKLRILNLKETNILSMPSGISTLTELRYLPYFPIGNVASGHAGVGELNKLVHLMDELAIWNLQTVGREEAKQCVINRKHLRRMNINWLCKDGIHDWSKWRKPESDEAVLEELKPHTYIRELDIDGYAGISLPSWMGDISFVNLKKMTLVHFGNCNSISAMEQLPSLEELHLFSMPAVMDIVSLEGSFSFQKLKRFKIVECASLQSIPLHKFPSLVELFVEQCAKLQNIDFIGQTANPLSIVIKQCDWLWFPSDASLPQSLKLFKVERCLMLNHWVRRNRTSKLRDAAYVFIDNCTISKTTEMERISPSSIADQMCEALHLAKMKKLLEDVGISKRKGMMVTDVGISEVKGKMFTDVGDLKGKKALEDTVDIKSIDMKLFNKILEELEDVDCKSRAIKAMLDDAEERSGKLEVECLRKLRSLAYMVEDLHDLFEYQYNAIRVESNSLDQVNHSLADPCFWKDIENRIKELKQQFDSTVQEDTCLHESIGIQWDLVQPEGSHEKFLGPLFFSYLRLPSHLKACLRFCCLFHRGEYIRRNDLVAIWLSHNLICTSTYNEGCLNRIAESFIDELASREFFQMPRRTNSGIIRIPDLVYDILQYVSGDEFQTIVGNREDLKLMPHHRHVRGFGRRLGEMDINNLRTFWIEKDPAEAHPPLAVPSGSSLRLLTIQKVQLTNLDDCLSTSKLLRVLNYISCSYGSTIQLPQSLFELYNLIYLNLSGCPISELSESISNMKNLRHLDVSWTGLRRMPDAIVELTNLRSLYIKGNNRLAYMPRGLSRLKGLEELDCFVAEAEGGLQELVDLVRDHPKDWPIFEIYGLQKVKNEDAIEDDILLNIRCHELSLHWQHMDLGFSLERTAGPEQEVVLNKLRPHSCIKQLSMERYKGSNLPAWMGDKSLVNLVSVSLELIHECTSISSLGDLPFLERLYIYKMGRLREVVSPLQSSSGSASTHDHILSFPKLTHISMHGCSSITSIPLYRFPALTGLYILDCSSLQIIEFSGPLECGPDFSTSTSSIQQIVISYCKQIQFQSEMAVPRSLELLYIDKCQKLSGWIRRNRRKLLRDVPEITLDDQSISIQPSEETEEDEGSAEEDEGVKQYYQSIGDNDDEDEEVQQCHMSIGNNDDDKEEGLQQCHRSIGENDDDKGKKKRNGIFCCWR